MKCEFMKPSVVHSADGLPATQDESVEVWVVPIGSGIMKYPCRLPVIPALTVPAGVTLD
jgi:hypothetical protein